MEVADDESVPSTACCRMAMRSASSSPALFVDLSPQPPRPRDGHVRRHDDDAAAAAAAAADGTVPRRGCSRGSGSPPAGKRARIALGEVAAATVPLPPPPPPRPRASRPPPPP